MNKTRSATQAEYRRGRKKAFRKSDYACVKCDGNATECHHVYGPEDNDPEHLRPLCYWCHLVAPTGDDYWVWEKSGESGPGRIVREVRPISRMLESGMSDAQFSELFDFMVSIALWSGRPIHRWPIMDPGIIDRMFGVQA